MYHILVPEFVTGKTFMAISPVFSSVVHSGEGRVRSGLNTLFISSSVFRMPYLVNEYLNGLRKGLFVPPLGQILQGSLMAYNTEVCCKTLSSLEIALDKINHCSLLYSCFDKDSLWPG